MRDIKRTVLRFEILFALHFTHIHFTTKYTHTVRITQNANSKPHSDLLRLFQASQVKDSVRDVTTPTFFPADMKWN